MKSEARIFDGMADGNHGAESFVFSIKTVYYGAIEQLSGNDPEGIHTCPEILISIGKIECTDTGVFAS